jgi:hypothetical protein
MKSFKSFIKSILGREPEMASRKPKATKNSDSLSDKERTFIDQALSEPSDETPIKTDTTTHHLFVKQGSKYLHHLAYVAQPEKDKWTSDKRLADRFIADDTTQANNVAKRKLGHSNYKLVKEPR